MGGVLEGMGSPRAKLGISWSLRIAACGLRIMRMKRVGNWFYKEPVHVSVFTRTTIERRRYEPTLIWLQTCLNSCAQAPIARLSTCLRLLKAWEGSCPLATAVW